MSFIERTLVVTLIEIRKNLFYFLVGVFARVYRVPFSQMLFQYISRFVGLNLLNRQSVRIDQFRYIKIQPNTIDLSTRLWRINPTNSVVIPQSLVLRYIALG